MRFAVVALLALICACGSATPAVEPASKRRAWRFESVLFDVPLAVAERLHRAADEREPALAVLVDERSVRAQLEELSNSDAGVERAVRPVIVIADGEKMRLPPRVDVEGRALGTLASDALTIDLGARGGHAWADCTVDFALEWTSGGSQRISGDTPQPADHFLVFVRTPARSATQKHAVFAFVRAHRSSIP